MDSASRARVEAWLRYSEGLGLGPYYRDRAPEQIAQAPAGGEISAGAEAAPVAAATAARVRVPVFGAAQKPATAAPFVPVATGPSLFEAAERVEGDTLEKIREDIGDCTRCRLHKARTNIVFGVGNPKAEARLRGRRPRA